MTKVKLPPVFKAKWVAALRSGKYKQARQALYKLNEKDKPSYCCLGVACSINGVTDIELGNNGMPEYVNTKILKKRRLPKFFYDVKNQDAILTRNKLVSLNDDDKWSFRKIATWIEKNL